MSNLPIGVFDSGVGGLTVLRALHEALPQEDLLYLGDTARLPYGTKSAETIKAYALQAARHLTQRGIKALVVACNTATAQALPALEAALDIPVIGVIEPGAALAAAHQQVLVLATEGTVRSGAYTAAIHRHNPQAQVSAVAATLLVGLAEEGWTEGPEAEGIIRRYFAGQPPAAAVVLGCTHFPLLKDAIRAVVGPAPVIVDSATTTAEAVAATLKRLNLLGGGAGHIHLLATDGAERFARLAARFLDKPIASSQIELVNL